MFKKTTLSIAVLVFFAVSCEKEEGLVKQEEIPVDSNAGRPDLGGRTASDCGTSVSGTYSTIASYHTYPQQNLNVGCAANGATITVFYNAVEIPNRFTIRDASGSFVVSSGWRGYASYGGPWGSSLSVSGTGTLTFTKSSSAYYIEVETLTPPNYSYSPNSDAWSASSSCTCAPACTPTSCPSGYVCQNGTCVIAPCTDPCGGSKSGTYSVISSYYTYPSQSFNVTCAASGATLTLFANSVEVPNRFTIRDASNNYVTSTGWIGYASYGGPWGSSLNGPSTKTVTFPKSTNTYYLVVETLTPPDYSYSPNTDAWSASLSCP